MDYGWDIEILASTLEIMLKRMLALLVCLEFPASHCSYSFKVIVS